MRLKQFILLGLILFMQCALIYGCAVTPPSPCIRDGKDYSRVDKTVHYDWDSCYRRGYSYMKGECPDFAIDEFKKAISEKPKDERLTRSYGMHFLGYFPHRELGIAYYIIGRTDDAIKELEKSIEDSPSSKAKFFLNEARKAWLKENDLDSFKPWLKINTPSSIPFFTNKLEITIEGQASDDQFVSALSINGEPMFIELSEENIPFSHTISLKPDLNEIVIAASDLLDKATEKKLQVIVDRTGPLINLSHSPIAQALNDGHFSILGVVHDESGVEVLNIDDMTIDLQPIEIEKGEYAQAFYSVIDISKDQKMVSILAKDRAGNATESSIELSPVAGSRRMISLRPEYGGAGKKNSCLYNQDGIRIASLEPFIPSSPAMVKDKESFDGPCHMESYQEEPYHEASAPSSEPFLFIDEEKIPNTTIFDEIYLMGKIQYQVPISVIQIFLNRNPIISKRQRLSFSGMMKRIIIRKLNELGLIDKIMTKFIHTGEDSLLFSEVIKLDMGPNEITVKVFDELGASRSQTFYVFKKKEDILDQKYRLCLSVLPVEDLSELEWHSPFTERYVFRKLDNAFADQNRFQVVDRERLEEILIEHDISASELSNEKQVVRTGRLLNAELVFSSFMRLKGDSIEINGTTIDTETSKKLYPEDIYLEEKYFKDKEEMIHRAVKILAMKIRDNFPLCRGNILKKKGAKIIVSIGNQEKIGDHTKLIVYRKDDLGTKFLSEARIEETINETSSAAVLLDKKKQEEINLKDLVITK